MATSKVPVVEALTSPEDIEAGIQKLAINNVLPLAKGVVLMAYPYHDLCAINVQWNRIVNASRENDIVFAVPRETFSFHIRKVTNVVAVASSCVEYLELNNHLPDGSFSNEFFEEALKSFGEAGHWKESLETLYLINWDFPPESSFSVLSLASAPSKLKSLDFRNNSRDVNIKACSAMVNSIAHKTPMLKDLSVSTCTVFSTCDDWILGTTLLGKLPEVCPRLSSIYIFEGNGAAAFASEKEVRDTTKILCRFPCLEDFSHYGRRLPQNAVDIILMGLLSSSKLKNVTLQKGQAGRDGIASLVQYLEKPFEDIKLCYLSLELSHLSTHDITLLVNAVATKTVDFQEDREPDPPPIVVHRQRRPPDPPSTVRLINCNLYLIRLQRFVKDYSVCPSLFPVVLAKHNQRNHRTRLFTMIKVLSGGPLFNKGRELRALDKTQPPQKRQRIEPMACSTLDNGENDSSECEVEDSWSDKHV